MKAFSSYRRRQILQTLRGSREVGAEGLITQYHPPRIGVNWVGATLQNVNTLQRSRSRETTPPMLKSKDGNTCPHQEDIPGCSLSGETLYLNTRWQRTIMLLKYSSISFQLRRTVGAGQKSIASLILKRGLSLILNGGNLPSTCNFGDLIQIRLNNEKSGRRFMSKGE